MGGAAGLWAQSKPESLKTRKEVLEKEIAYTNKLIQDISKNKKSTLYSLQLINNKINRRMELIAALKREIYALNDSLAANQRSVEKLSDELEQMKSEYARIAYYLYKNNNPYTRMMFVFSADDINQAYQRLRYLNEIAAYIRKQAVRIKSMEQLKQNKIYSLQRERKQKNRLLDQQTTQLSRLELEQQRKNKVRRKLSGQESQLRATLRKKRKESQKLDQQIAKAIAAASVKKQPGKKKTTAYSLTPTEKKLSETFAANKGRLPWPVKNGIVAQTFGVHNHPVLKHVQIKNNGLNIATSLGTPARAVFAGKVVSIVHITTTNIAVIVKHGDYFSVYSGLDKVFVKVNSHVDRLQNIGKIHTSLQGKTELHFELWKGKQLQNPSWWLAHK
jgi:septal ring factor EnvC (AmiA/AmiB activator)